MQKVSYFNVRVAQPVLKLFTGAEQAKRFTGGPDLYNIELIFYII